MGEFYFDLKFAIYAHFLTPAKSYCITPVKTDKDLLGLATLEVYNLLGKKQLAVQLSSAHMVIDVTDLIPGVYFYSIHSEHASLQVGKVVVP